MADILTITVNAGINATAFCPVQPRECQNMGVCVQSSGEDLVDCLDDAGSADPIAVQELGRFTAAWHFHDRQSLDRDVTALADRSAHGLPNATWEKRWGGSNVFIEGL